ncbi:outer mitochondrial transmembrane helix translocase-like [Sitodiplosis mosellana]|uniref:outer mitochondrial transmembrane helix translocase-like n=1 Tax=Sitodiplosis mosellana TaxID=263140 RepID=UPI0024452FFB|nr:outer mitochondrial transmembrane helix translocase-like [Sitodiplosis mosellana]
MDQLSRNDIIAVFVRVGIGAAVAFYSLKWFMNQMDPTIQSKKRARTKAEFQIKRITETDKSLKIDISTLSDYELVIASHLVVPEDINVSWADIAGLDSVIQELRENVVLPIRHRHLYSSSQLWKAPSGVLLHGPPGCGKTLIAKATAKEADMRFINLDIAMLTDKWYGESQKLASAVFSLATKLQPCIIFIDEIDSFLRSRSSHDHEATAMMKTQFMMLWDGLATTPGATIIVMGATNRPKDLDRAILRRMPAQFVIGAPDTEQRRKILQLVLETESVASDVDLNRLAKLAVNFSGSDLRELCRNASVARLREFVRVNDGTTSDARLENTTKLDRPPPPISMQHLLDSFGKMKESKMHTGMLGEHRIDLD